MPEYGPAFVKIVPAPGGWFLVTAFHLDTDPARSWVVDSLGRVVAVVETPAGVELVEMGERHLLGIQTDLDGLQSAIVYGWDSRRLAGRDR